jgi:hypothetical protein
MNRQARLSRSVENDLKQTCFYRLRNYTYVVAFVIFDETRHAMTFLKIEPEPITEMRARLHAAFG